MSIAGLLPLSNDNQAATYLYEHYHGMAHVCIELKKMEMAKSYLERALAGHSWLNGSTSPRAINDMLCLGKLLIQMGDRDQATNMLTGVMEAMTHIDSDPDGEYDRLSNLAESISAKLREGSVSDFATAFERCFQVHESSAREDSFDGGRALSPY